MTPPDWSAFTNRIFADTRAAFERFAERYPGEMCCHVQYDCDPGNGYMALGFDTPAASIVAAHEHHERRLAHIRKMLDSESMQRDAHNFLKRNAVLPLNLGVASVAYPEEMVWEAPEWVKFAMSEEYPQRTRLGGYVGDDYLDAAVALSVWRVVERLDAEGAFSLLPLAQPCVVSYWHHDDDLAIIRILNWPAV